MNEPSFEVPPKEKDQDRRLDSWKEIAAYLDRDVTTVQRWEKREGMPVHRHLHDKRGSVYATEAELDEWRRSRGAAPTGEDAVTEPAPMDTAAVTQRRSSRSQIRLWAAAGLTVIALGAIAALTVVQYRSRKAPPAQIRSIAVLPLRNLSGDASQDYLAEGMTEALIDRLASIQDLRVTSYTSVMRFKNAKATAPEIARSLGVDALVEGSVVRDGSRIRVTAQLIRGSTDEHFWSQTYDREMRDALTLESEVAQAIAQRVQVTVSGPEHERLAAASPIAPEVYESYLKGTFLLEHERGRADIEGSISEFDDALKKDPKFAPAYLGLARAYKELGTIFAGVPKTQTVPKAISAAEAALKLVPDLAQAHVLLGDAYQQWWQWARAEAEFRQGLDLSPNDASAHEAFALWLLCQGRKDEALSWMFRARALDPVRISGNGISWVLFQSRRYDEALRETRTELAVRPDDTQALMNLGFVFTANGQPANAIPPLEKVVAASQGSPGATGLLIRAYALAGRRSDALRLLSQLQERHRSSYVPAGAFVNAYLGLGDTEKTFVWLEKAYDEHANILQFLKTHPYFDPIRGDPRFKDLVHRVGLD